ncbi:MAG: phosphate ABC transporter substrate-binding protein [Thiohalomonadales bacterium]
MRKFHFLIFFLIINISSYAYADIVVVVNVNFNAEQISQKKLRKLWLGKSKKLENVGRIIIVDQNANNTITRQFYKTIIKKERKQIKAYWAKLEFIGKGYPPKTLINDKAVIEWIQNNKNGIGYINSNSITDKIKVVMTIPGEQK